jgi:hypothetical protein
VHSWHGQLPALPLYILLSRYSQKKFTLGHKLTLLSNTKHNINDITDAADAPWTYIAGAVAARQSLHFQNILNLKTLLNLITFFSDTRQLCALSLSEWLIDFLSPLLGSHYFLLSLSEYDRLKSLLMSPDHGREQEGKERG